MGKKVELNKSVIKDNALKAMVKSNLFRHKVFKNKKGKGSYSRKKVDKYQPFCFILLFKTNRL